MNRRISRQVAVEDVRIGGGAPIVVQSMTNTDTEDARSTAEQVAALARAGSEIVRITVNTVEAARQVPEIRNRLEKMGVRVPLVGDFHFNGHKLLTQVPDCAVVLDKYRINPGNVGHGSKRDEQFSTMVERGTSLARALFAFNSANVEGWGLYAEYILYPYMPPDGKLISLQLRLTRAARGSCSPSLAGRGIEEVSNVFMLMGEASVEGLPRFVHLGSWNPCFPLWGPYGTG